MTPERWKQIRELFNHAIALAPAQRQDYLARNCTHDTDLQVQVERLLRSSEKDNPFIEQVVNETSREILRGDSDLHKMKEIGPYRVLLELGRGGMGTVYLAERADKQFQQKVAIKLIHSDLASKEILQRFRAERQILAVLNHPNIARLIDGGTTEEGLPYLVMEYIQGEAIDFYCDRNRLKIKQRLNLFQQVCSAVHYAHQNLIVHRDIKASNILVTEQGVPKLLDFGIAKLLDRKTFPQTLALTRADHRLMTPEYASPEQIRGGNITTASDEYSLGVLLYQLLCGHMPYYLVSPRPAELERLICETEPPVPSITLTRTASLDESDPQGDDGISPEVVSQRRNTPTDKLRRQLKGELDNIVLMAMRKEPERRYGSVEQFSQDIQRYMDNLPILARRDAWSYRTRKFIKRNTVAVSFTFVFIATLIGFLLHEQGLRQHAEQEAEKAEAVSTFLQEMLSSIDPKQAQGEVVTVRQVLERSAQKLEHVETLGKQVLIKANLEQTVGNTYLALGDYQEAEPHLRKALDLHREHAGKNHRLTWESLNQVGHLYRLQGKYSQAKEKYDQATRIAESDFGKNSRESMTALYNLAVLYQDQGNYRKAKELYQQVLKSQSKTLPPLHIEILETLTRLGLLHVILDQLDQAQKYLTEALQGQQSVLGARHPVSLNTMNNLALAYFDNGNYDQAESLFLETLDIQTQVLGKDHPDTLQTLSNLSGVYYYQRRYDEAIDNIKQTLELLSNRLGENHPMTIRSMNDLAVLYRQQKRYQESLPLTEKVLRATLDLVGEEHDETPGYMTNLAYTHMKLGNLQQAEPLYQRALEIRRKLFGPDHIDTLDSMYNLAALYQKQGRYAEAEPLAVIYYERMLEKFGSDHVKTRKTIRFFIRLYEAWNKPSNAVQYRKLLSTESAELNHANN